MPAEKRLSTKERREELIRESDRLRENCSEIWARADYQAGKMEQRFLQRIFVRPAVPELLGTGLFLLQARLGPQYRHLAPLFSVAERFLSIGRAKMEPEELSPERERETEFEKEPPVEAA